MSSSKDWFSSLSDSKRKLILGRLNDVRHVLLARGNTNTWNDLNELLVNLEDQHQECKDSDR